MEKVNFDIVELDDFSGPCAHIYSIRLQGEEETLLDKFFDENRKYQKELSFFAAKLKVIGNDTGCRYEDFKLYEGSLGDGIVALSYKRMRLYCMRFNDVTIIVGDGGYKSPNIRAYQEDANLNAKVDLMKRIAAQINKELKDGLISITKGGIIEREQHED